MVKSNDDVNRQQTYKSALKMGAGAAGLGIGALAYKDAKKYIQGIQDAKNAPKEANFIGALSELTNREIDKEQSAKLLELQNKTYRGDVSAITRANKKIPNIKSGNINKAQYVSDAIDNAQNFIKNAPDSRAAKALSKVTKLMKL